ncbi:MAG TPA: hypothetical protein VE571_00435 [Solirubrobacteraceae bacterium]|nr:hypothetical protein [Solirubrobacteraceae bacterium]
MTWVESASESFTARHDATAADDARQVLRSLERTREHLAGYFPRMPRGVTVVLHGGPAGLALTNPLMPLIWLSTAPAARRYVVGWAGRTELHMLEPSVLAARASTAVGGEGVSEMLEHGAACLYARQVIIASNKDLARVMVALRLRRELRWAWLLEGAARWFGGQTAHARPAIARRLREGGPPSFPPGPRDAALLGGTVIDLLAREEGAQAAARFACRLHPQGARAALSQAFGGRPLAHTEGAWRSHLARLAAG